MVTEEYRKSTTTGMFVSKFGENHLNVPVGIGTDSNNNVYVAESGGNRVSKFTSTGQLITMWGSSGVGLSQFKLPKGLTLDQNNNVYVADEFNDRIQKFDSNGNFITEFGQDRLGHPIDVAIDSQARVYASDENNGQILIYASSDQNPSKSTTRFCVHNSWKFEYTNHRHEWSRYTHW